MFFLGRILNKHLSILTQSYSVLRMIHRTARDEGDTSQPGGRSTKGPADDGKRKKFTETVDFLFCFWGEAKKEGLGEERARGDGKSF